MQFRSRPVVFAIATALGAGLAVPAALALTSSTPSPTTTNTTATSAEAQHEAQAAGDHEADRSELGAANATQTQAGATDDATTKGTTADAAPAATTAQQNTNTPGATGDEHRSDVAAEHSQADEHRAVAPGVPAQKAGDQAASDNGATTAAQHRGSHVPQQPTTTEADSGS